MNAELIQMMIGTMMMITMTETMTATAIGTIPMIMAAIVTTEIMVTMIVIARDNRDYDDDRNNDDPRYDNNYSRAMTQY